MPRQFDLNIERVLEHWTTAHAVREIIANALDECSLTDTETPVITNDNGAWHIRDFGRGLRYEHLTQNESLEKIDYPDRVVGKFGVGLKDALATFDRRNVGVMLRSPHGDITIAKAQKPGFSDLVTLHAMIDVPSDPSFVGTDVILTGVLDAEIEEAKGFFLGYTGDELIDQTRHGAIHKNSGRKSRIYVNGLCIAEEDNFLFSYNITSMTAQLRKALNRERTNVGRSAYTDRVKAILLASTSELVAEALTDDLSKFETGRGHDELQWTDVSVHASRILNSNADVIFLTAEQLREGGSLVTHAQNDGHRIIVVPETIASRLPSVTDFGGAPLRDLNAYRAEWNDSFQFEFVSVNKLSPSELSVYNRSDDICKLAGLVGRGPVLDILISETMRDPSITRFEAVGLWEASKKRIIVKRSQLLSLESYSATLLHELAHAISGGDDGSEEFEDALTRLLGKVALRSLH